MVRAGLGPRPIALETGAAVCMKEKADQLRGRPVIQTFVVEAV
jgi:hypothetical protein